MKKKPPPNQKEKQGKFPVILRGEKNYFLAFTYDAKHC